MSIAIITPEEPVTVTEAAKQHFRERIRIGAAKGIRLCVKPSGCTGYMYDLSLADETPDEDLSLAVGEDLFLYIDRQALPILQGTTINYVREGLNSLLRFENPNAGDICGCGESFSIINGESV